jgi:ABC-2 type transport system ATP-binding protein
MEQAMVQVRELVVAYGDRVVVDRLSLSVQPGTIYALLGGNGAGKSTTLQAVLGLVRPRSGEVLVAGRSCTQDPRHARDALAYLPENVALYPYLSGVENLRYFCGLAGQRLLQAQAQALLAQAGLAAADHHRRASDYSKGMRQKVGLAIAHAKRARAMLLDEPTSGLDPSAANELSRQLCAARDAGMAILMATHDLFNARELADRIGILQRGRLVEEFSPDSIGPHALEAKYLAHARAAA